MREVEIGKGKAKKQTLEKVTPSPGKQKANDTGHLAVIEKHKIPPKKSKPAKPTTDTPPKRSPRLKRTLRKEIKAPKGQVNIEVEEDSEEQTNIALVEVVAVAEQVENQEPLQPEQDEQYDLLQPEKFEQHESVRGNILVGKHKPPTFSWAFVALNLWNEMQKKEEWNKERLKLQEEVKKKNAKIEEKNTKIIALKDKVDNVIAPVPQMMVCRTPP